MTDCGLHVVMWWSERGGCSGRPSSEYHERVHVNIVKSLWEMRDGAIAEYLHCTSMPKASCHKQLIEKIDQLYFDYTMLAQTRWDADDNKHPSSTCQAKAEEYRNHIPVDEYSVRVSEEEVASMKRQCAAIKDTDCN